MKIFSIGKIVNKKENVKLVLKKEYKDGLLGLDGFGHALILWWMDGTDNESSRNTLVENKPYKKGPERVGVFALRSPERPNPIAVSTVDIAYVDIEKGEIGLYYVDAFDGTDVVDIKPYTPSIDRIEHPSVPSWSSHWPLSYEKSSDFDWESESNF